MLLVSNLFLWENVSSAPLNASEAALSDLKDLFDNATAISGKLAKLGTAMRKEFWSTALSHDVFLKGNFPTEQCITLQFNGKHHATRFL